MADLISRRLRAHHLVGKPFTSAAEAVLWFGAVQSQDYPAAKWAVGQRMSAASEADIDTVFDNGDVLRTHVMRPTWHFVAPADIRWIQELTSARLLQGLAGRHRQLDLDARTVARAADLFGHALAGGRFMTRAELGQVLETAGISTAGQRLPHLIATAEHANVITSGPRRGKQFTYALLAERAPRARVLDRDESLKELTIRYFRSHGPALLKDFAWWSGLTTKDIRRGIELAGKSLECQEIDGDNHWFGAGQDRGHRPGNVVHLLPNFDEYTVAYRDRGALLDPSIPFDAKHFAYYRDTSPIGGILSNVVTIGGRVRGAWSRTTHLKSARLDVRLLAPLRPMEAEAIRAAATRLGRFFGVNVQATIRWQNP